MWGIPRAGNLTAQNGLRSKTSTGYSAYRRCLVPGVRAAAAALVQPESTARPGKAKSVREADEHATSRTTPRLLILRSGLLFVLSYDVGLLSFARDPVLAVLKRQPSGSDHLLRHMQATNGLIAAGMIEPVAAGDEVSV